MIHANKALYLKTLDKLDRQITSAESKVMRSILKEIKGRVSELSLVGNPSKSAMRTYYKEINTITKEVFAARKYQLYNEVIKLTEADAHRYSRALGHFLGKKGKPVTYVQDTLLGWSDKDYSAIRAAYLHGTSSIPTIAKYKKNLERMFSAYGYDSDLDTLYRGLNVTDDKYRSFLHSLKPGSIFSDRSPTSWSDSLGNIEYFAPIDGSKGNSFVLKVDNAQGLGYDISKQVKHEYEAERLIRPNEGFKVKSVTTDEHGRTVIALEPTTDYGTIHGTFIKPQTAISNRLKYSMFETKNFQFEDKSVEQMYKSLQRSVGTSARREAASLYLDGYSPGDISKEVSAKFGLGGKGRAIRSRARAFFKTSIAIIREDMRSEAEAKYETYIWGWEFDAHLDNRTTEGCTRLDGTKYRKSKPTDTKKDTVPADSLVPRHFNCRSMLIPIPYEPDTKWVKVDTEDLGDKIRETWELRRYFGR